MVAISQSLTNLITTTKPRLLSIAENRAAEKPYPDKWSIKEILGHLIDSAATNHQRMVRMQESADIGTWVYEQEHWVKSQDYQSEPWEDVVHVWYYYNKHIAHIMARIDPACVHHTCEIGYPKPATLKYIVEDYVRHQQHHLDQIFSDADPRERKHWVVVGQD